MRRRAEDLRIVYRPDYTGRVFKVQENRASAGQVGNWRTIAGFENLTFALEEFPTASPDAVAVRHQRELEESRHAFERSNSRRPECSRCGRSHSSASQESA